MTPETRVVLANCAGSFLLLIAFLFLILVSALLLLFVRGLWLARNASPEQLARLHGMADRARQQTTDTASSVIDPQIQLASTWAGVKAGVRVFLSASPGPKTDSTSVASRTRADRESLVGGRPSSRAAASGDASSRSPTHPPDHRLPDQPPADAPGQPPDRPGDRLVGKPAEQPTEQIAEQTTEQRQDEPPAEGRVPSPDTPHAEPPD